jgi:hypothetical protein
MFREMTVVAIALLITSVLETVHATGTKKAAFTFPEFQYKETSKNVSLNCCYLVLD